MWLDPYVHVGPATLAAFVASVWYLYKSVRNTTANKPEGSYFLLSLIIFFTGLGVICLITFGHSDLYSVNGVDYTLLTAFAVLLSAPIFLLCLRGAKVQSLKTVPSLEIRAIAGGLLICMAAHLFGVLGFPFSHNRINCGNAYGCTFAFLFGGVQGVGLLAFDSFLETFFAVAVVSTILKLQGFLK